ncbi:hypothetical protein, partial [Winogradskyella sp.]
MNEKLSKYHLFENKERFHKSLMDEINRSVFKKKFNISGESVNGGFEVYNSVSFILFKPNFGPIIKLRVTYLGINEIESESIINLKRVNGMTFYAQYWFSLCFAILTLGVCTYQIVFNSYKDISIIMLPVFGIIYFLIINLIANNSVNSLKSRIEKILKTEKIK